MIQTWSCDRVALSDCRRWVYSNAMSLVWKRFRYWKNRLRLPDNLKTIDVGCGYGKFSMVLGLSGAQVTLLDYNASALEAALDAHRSIGLAPKGVQCDILNLPAELEGVFDVACSFGTLEHFSGKYRQAAFQANVRLLRPGGLLFFYVPNRYGIFYRIAFGLRRKLGFVPRDFYEEPFSRKELNSIAAASGAITLEIECIGTLKNDFRYWIGENVKSLYRKLFRVKKDDLHRPPTDPDIKNINLSEEIQDPRNYLDRRLSGAWLFVGQKAGKL